MRKLLLLSGCALGFVWVYLPSEAPARGGFGGGGGFRGGGGAVARPAGDYGGGVARPAGGYSGGFDRPAGGYSGGFDRPATSYGSEFSRPAGFSSSPTGVYEAAGSSQRPTTGDVSHFLNMPRDAAGNVGSRVDQAGANRQDRVDNRQQDVNKASQTRQDRQQNLSQLTKNQNTVVNQYNNWGNNVRVNVGNKYNNWFTPNWWHNHAWWPWFPNNYPGHYWWRWGTWPGITGWIPWTWAQPIYYVPGGNVVYYPDYVYVNEQPVATPQDYAQQAIDLASTGVQALEGDSPDGKQPDWLPLGVFALSQDDKTDPTMFLQLAVSKDGTIGGTYQNSTTDQSLPIYGSVDKKTQRACWTVGDKKDTVMETGIFNLTKDETPVLIHFGKDKTQTWLLTRLQQPKDDGAKPPAGQQR